MSKELEALEQLKYYNTLANDDFDMTQELSVIETALQELDGIKSGKIRLAVKSGEYYVAVPKYQYEQDQKKLKALEIIKEKRVDVNRFLIYDLKIYNDFIAKNEFMKLTQEDYDLLKKVLL